MLTAIGWIVLALLFFVIRGIYKLLKYIFRSVGDEISIRRYSSSTARFEAQILKTKILNRNKKFISNRKYYHETTFMIYYTDGTHTAQTIENGTGLYDNYMSKLEE